MKKRLLLILTLSLGLYSTESSAQIFDLEVTDYDGAESIPALKSFVDEEIQKIEDEVNGDLPSAPPERLMEGMANSSVMAGKGVGSDYASGMKVMMIGAGVGVGADQEKDPGSDSDLSGVGVAPGIILGANLGFLGKKTIFGMNTRRLNMYVNYMGYSHDQTIEDKPGKESEAKIDMLAMGVHFRYDWIKGRGNKLLGWGGVKFNFGYELNQTKILFNANINEVIDETDSDGNRIQGTLTGKPEATIESMTHSIPLELSTDIRLLYILSLYTGVGVDANFGSAKGKGALNANESTISCTNGGVGACSAPRNIKVQATANIDAEGKVIPFTARTFAGVQINLPGVRIFGQVNKAIGSELVGVAAGVRFVY